MANIAKMTVAGLALSMALVGCGSGEIETIKPAGGNAAPPVQPQAQAQPAPQRAMPSDAVHGGGAMPKDDVHGGGMGGMPGMAPAGEGEPTLALSAPVNGVATATVNSPEGKRTFSVPADWKSEKPTSMMRLGQFKIPGPNGADAELVVFKMNAGALEANITRWQSQFGGPASMKSRRTMQTGAAEEATVVELEGDYAGSSMGGGASELKKDQKMFGAVIPTKGGDFFFKLTGPRPTVDTAKPSFEKIIETLK